MTKIARVRRFLTEGDGEDPAFFAAQLEMEQQTDPHKSAVREHVRPKPHRSLPS